MVKEKRRGIGIAGKTAIAAIGLAILPIGASTMQAGDGALQFADLGVCKLENGRVIEDCRIGYRTFGRLNDARDNAVLMPTWLYGTSEDLKPLFGDGSAAHHLVDTTRFFGVAIDALGNGVSSSPSNTKRQQATAFPELTLRDSVEAQYRVLTEVLGIKHLHAVIGLSMGGEQTFAWSVAHPEYFDLAIPILGTPRLTSYDLVIKQMTLDAIESDPAYAKGHYSAEPPLKLANLLGAVVVTSPTELNEHVARDTLPAYFSRVEAPQAIDANDRVWQLRAIMLHDAIGTRSLAQAAHSTRARFLVIVNAEDHLVNPQPALDWAAALGAPVYISHGLCAHLIMNCDAAAVSSRVRQFLIDSKTGSKAEGKLQ